MTIRNFLKSIFGINFLVADGGTVGVSNMTARIIPASDGGFLLVNKSNKAIVPTSYGRARDAKRGALRRGLTLVG